jgi:hypothetical protein
MIYFTKRIYHECKYSQVLQRPRRAKLQTL